MIKYVNAMAMGANLRNAREQRGASEEQVINEIVSYFTDRMNQKLADKIEAECIKKINVGDTDAYVWVDFNQYDSTYGNFFYVANLGRWISPEGENPNKGNWRYKGIDLSKIADEVIDRISVAYKNFLINQGLIITEVKRDKHWDTMIYFSLTEFND